MRISQVFSLEPLRLHFALTVAFITTAAFPVSAITFTNDTTIGVTNTDYDGAEVMVTNCTLTVDGPHAFSSLLVASGGVLTHSFYPGGSLSNFLSVANEPQFLSGTDSATLLNSNIVAASVSVTDSSGAILYTNGLNYLLTSPDGLLTQLRRTTNSTISDGTNVLVSYNVLLSVWPAGLNVAVAGNVQVAPGGAIDVRGRGYAGGTGSGKGASRGSPQQGSGGGYGGYGGMSLSNLLGGAVYGSYLLPTNVGSGGGSGSGGAGGAGGGAIRLTVGGLLVVNGSVLADGENGTNSGSGGGSGGSICLAAGSVYGIGRIAADGGAGDTAGGGGGSGGRVAIQYGSGGFAGAVAACGATGAQTGGAGTVFTKLAGNNGLLLVDNGGLAGTNTPVSVADRTIDVLIGGDAIVNANNANGAWSLGSLTISTNGWLAVTPSARFDITVAGNLTIQAGGGLIADSAGYGAGGGSGYGYPSAWSPYYACGGGGHGGWGGAGGVIASGSTGAGSAYDSQSSPNMVGSGGGGIFPQSPGGQGGGAVHITSLGGLVQVDGRLSANGGDGSGLGGGGGSGGSIWLTGGTLLGSGSITANGGSGAGSVGGGGGGGRICISPATNWFDGTISAYGGGGTNWGGAGTIWLQASGQSAQLVLDNGDHEGTNTLFQSASGVDLVVRGAALGYATGSASFANLLLAKGSWLTPAYSSSGLAPTLDFSFSGNAIIASGAGIVADRAGYWALAGSGAGRVRNQGSTNVCSGAGHGGFGGDSLGGDAAGGVAYDSETSPSSPGSGGGAYAPLSPGGAGGGAVRLNVTGTLQLDGLISAGGGSGSGIAGGGGSGGSISLSAGTLSGSGCISANGGDGAGVLGGGGGGGRVAVSCNSSTFSGGMSAWGGSGATSGGAGTVFVLTGGQNSKLVLDNGGRQGAVTPIDYAYSTCDLTLRNGALGFLHNPPPNLASLIIASNSWLICEPTNSNVNPSGSISLTVSGNATLQPGGGIRVDSAAPTLGPGAGQYSYTPPYACSGAGHGGSGGAAWVWPPGGATYDSTVSPTSCGSGGGSYALSQTGGVGGGSVRLTVSGTLQLAGTISANGGAGGGTGGGGGSGGSVWLTLGTLAGTGSIAANGGNGTTYGGGGGGGRISVSYNTSSFAGAMSACGGGGANAGGAGTIYLKTNSQMYANLILDNAGRIGANTTFDAVSADLYVLDGAVGQPPSTNWSVRNLQIRSNSVLKTRVSTSLQTITVTGNAAIDATSAISADGAGNSAELGAGAGSSDRVAGGGGHGGLGAANPSHGGGAYGSIQSPVNAGSGGARAAGGAGGGALRLTVAGTLALSGRISASGQDGGVYPDGSGGGSGGSLLVTAGTLLGSGLIRANGGSGNDSGGGGGGGRISVACGVNGFTGALTAFGGDGGARGGAGTIYTKLNNQTVGQISVDNGGPSGAITPISSIFDTPSPAFNLTLGNGAVVSCQPGFPLLSNLTVGAGGVLSGPASQTNAELVVLKNVDIAPGGAVLFDAGGYSQACGPGAGLSDSGSGSGAGYGGVGGASASAAGGPSYGSVQQPLELGSGGGFGDGPLLGGSAGGGGLRLSVGGILTVDGQLSADGENALQQNAGGGSGGSLWVIAGTLAGSGQVTADGGRGDAQGGGGAGGRIALYSKANIFFGQLHAAGGEGYSWGASGSIVTSNDVAPLQVLSHSPVGAVSNGVNCVDLLFNAPPDPASLGPSAMSLAAPNGPLSSGSLSISMVSPECYRLSFPLQTAIGDYAVEVSADVKDLFGQTLSQAYSGSFTISLPVVQGTVTDANGQPVAGVVLQPNGALSSAITDTNGNYALGFPPGSSFIVTPAQGDLVFVPKATSYTNLTASISNQNYLAVTTLAPTLAAAGCDATNFYLNWQALPGVTYQVFSSTNLADWLPCGAPIVGANGQVQVAIPVGSDPAKFLRVAPSQ